MMLLHFLFLTTISTAFSPACVENLILLFLMNINLIAEILHIRFCIPTRVSAHMYISVENREQSNIN
jgi:hypothetical protein